MADVRVVYQPEVGQVVNTADLAAWLATDAGRAAIRAGVRAEWASFATWLHNDGNIFMASKIRQWLAAPREPAQDGGSAAQPQQGAYPPQAQPRGAAGAATCTCGGRLTLQHRAGCSMAREPAQDEPAAGAGPGPLKVTPESMATQLESVASVLVARFMPAESAVCTVGAEMPSPRPPRHRTPALPGSPRAWRPSTLTGWRAGGWSTASRTAGQSRASTKWLTHSPRPPRPTRCCRHGGTYWASDSGR